MHVFADKQLEVLGIHLAQAFESGDFQVLLVDFLRGLVAFLFVVAVEGLLLVLAVAHAEERRLQYVEVLLLHEFREVLQEERHHQKADVHTVHIGIGGDNHLVVAQVLEPVFDVEGGLEQVPFLVLVHDFLGEAVAVLRLAAQAEHRLGLGVTCRSDGTGGGITLGNEYHGLALERVLRVGEVHAAVTELLVVEVCLLGALVREFLDAGQFLAQLFVLRDAFQELLGRILVLVEVIVQFAGHKIHNPGTERGAVRGRGGAAQLCLGLGFENRFLDAHGNGSHDAVAHVGSVVFLLEVVAHALHQALAECRLVGTALGGVLAVHETEVVLAFLVGVRDGELDVLALAVDDRVADGVVGAAVEQVQEPVRAVVILAVHHQREPVVQVGVVPDLLFHVGGEEPEVLEQVVIGLEVDFGAVFLGGGGNLEVLHQNALAELGALYLAVAETLYDKLGRKGVHRLGTHTVHAHRLLEGFGIVLAARIHLRHAVDDLLERDAAAVVAHAAAVVFHVDFNLLARAHGELVDGVVDNFLREHVDAVVGALSVAQLADVHTGAEPNVFVPI